MVELYECMNYLLSKAQMTVTTHFKNALAPYDITPVQCGVLNCLYKADGIGLKSLCDCLGVNASTMTGIVDRMEARGLVERRADPTDRRALAVFLTDKGKSLEAVTAEAIEESNEFALNGFTERQAEQLKSMLLDVAARTATEQPQPSR